ncbi:hypothetical protein RF638_15470 [Kocuria sp. CPCC 205235]|uniref:hypothetical protein n=1 Tax=Kocuria sp. CPCC 205235 TaxID=3073549 RepID=UPI0034D504A8
MKITTPQLRQAVPTLANLALGKHGSLDYDPATGESILELNDDRSWVAVVTVRTSQTDTPQIGVRHKTIEKARIANESAAPNGVAILYTWLADNAVYLVCAEENSIKEIAEPGGLFAVSEEMMYIRRDRFEEAKASEATIFTARWSLS